MSGTPEKMTFDISLIDSEGKKIKTLASFPAPPRPQHFWTHRLSFCPLNEELGVYGYSTDYKLYIVKSSGKIAHIIEKKEHFQLITKKEKDKFVDFCLEKIYQISNQ